MTTNDITTDATPVRLTAFDNYEISPCTRTEEPDRPGHNYFEVCEPHEADVWTLYGHIHGEGADAIGDFATRAHAEETFQRITGIALADARQVEAHLRVMHAGPRLFEALVACANLLADYDDSEGEEGDAYREAVAAIEQATGRAI